MPLKTTRKIVRSKKLKPFEVYTKYKDKTFDTMTLDERKEFVAAIPYVTRLVGRHQCELAAIRKSRPCRQPAFWKFKYRTPRGAEAKLWCLNEPGKTVTVCWNHLWHNGIMADPGEETRYNNWLRRVGLKGSATVVMPDETHVAIRQA